MNKNIALGIYGGLAILGIIGVFLILLIRPEAQATAVQFVFQLLGIVGIGVGLQVTVSKQKESTDAVAKTLDKVQSQTNGTLTAYRDENSALRDALLNAGVDTAAIPKAPNHE